MQFLLGLIAYVGISAIVARVFFYRTADANLRLRKGLIATAIAFVLIICGVLLILEWENLPFNKDSETYSFISNEEDSIDDLIEIRNVISSGPADNDTLYVFIEGSCNNENYDSLNIAVWFYERTRYNEDRILLDFNNRYSTTDGQATVQSMVSVPSNSTLIKLDGFGPLAIPIKELHLNKLKTTSPIRISLAAGVFHKHNQLCRSNQYVYNILDE